jgi:hypothetical protein
VRALTTLKARTTLKGRTTWQGQSFEVGVEGFAAAESVDEDSFFEVSAGFDESDVEVDAVESPDLRA